MIENGIYIWNGHSNTGGNEMVFYVKGRSGYLKLHHYDVGRWAPTLEEGYSVVITDDYASSYSSKEEAEAAAQVLNKKEQTTTWEVVKK